MVDNQNVMTAGPRSPQLLQDVWFLEKLAHFDREVIPERRMHAKGSGAYGTFTVTNDITKYTRARIFSQVGKKTDLFVRFSTVAGERGIPASYRHMHGFGSHTFSFINAANERFWVKFHLKAQQGIKNLSDTEAETLVGKDRETHQRDLYDAIEGGNCPKWTVAVQIMPETDAEKVPYHPFDLTKIWPHKDYPLIEVGVMELNRNPANYFAEVEQAAFNPANVVPGISFSPDKMLQGRLFSYGNAQRYRLGVNHAHIPVNAPKCPFHSYHRDGAMRIDSNFGSTLGYEPNSYSEWQEQPDYREPPLAINGTADHWNYREDDDDYYSQPRALFHLMSPAAANAVRQHRPRHGRCAGRGQAPSHRELHQV